MEMSSVEAGPQTVTQVRRYTNYRLLFLKHFQICKSDMYIYFLIRSYIHHITSQLKLADDNSFEHRTVGSSHFYERADRTPSVYQLCNCCLI